MSTLRLQRPGAPFAPLVLAALVAVLPLFAACGGGEAAVRIVPITSTPGEGSGGILPPTSSTSTETPVPPSAEVPERPDNPLSGALDVVSYLAGGEADIEGCLPELVAEWNLAPIDGDRCFLADVAGDREAELIFLVTVEGEPGDPGDVWFFEHPGDEDARLLSSARALANLTLENVTLEAAVDLTGDGRADPLISSQTCGASVCSTRFVIASAHTGSLRDLAPGDATVASLESVAVEDRTDDGLPDVVLSGGQVTTAGAGPQRTSQRVLTWSGLEFLDREEPAEPVYLIHAIADADALFAAASYGEARDAYDAVIGNTSLQDWRVEAGQPPGRPELEAYAGFRAALSALRLGNGDEALSRLEGVMARAPDTLHGQAAAVYFAALSGGTQPSIACSATEQYLQSQADTFAAIWDYGFGNPEHSIGGFCR